MKQISLFCDGLLALEALWPKSFIWWQSSTEMKLKMVFLYKDFFFRKYSNSGNIAKELTYEHVFWIDDADKHFFLSDIT